MVPELSRNLKNFMETYQEESREVCISGTSSIQVTTVAAVMALLFA